MIALMRYEFPTEWSNKHKDSFYWFTFFLPVGLWGHAFWLTNSGTLWEPQCGVHFYIQNPTFPNLFTKGCLHKPFRYKIKLSELKKAIKWPQWVKDLGWESTWYAWRVYCLNYQAGHITLAVSSHEHSKVLLYVNCVSQLPQKSAPMGNSAQATVSSPSQCSLHGSENGTVARKGLGASGEWKRPTDSETSIRQRTIHQNGIHC